MKKSISMVMILGLLAVLVAACSTPAAPAQPDTSSAPAAPKAERKVMRFVMIPLVTHPWFDAVYKGAEEQAAFLSSQLDYDVKIEYNVPQAVDIALQNSMLQQAAATNPDGIAICPGDIVGSKAIIEEVQARGIPVALINQMPPVGFTGLVGAGNNFTEQGQVAARRMVELLGGKGKVAVMHGVATANTHIERYTAILDVLAQYPDIVVVEAGFDNDEFETGMKLAAATIAAHPDLAGFLTVDASGPIGIINAVREAGKAGQIKVVGMDDLIEILTAVKDGTLDSTSSTIPKLQGSMITLMLWQAANGKAIPKFVDTGVAFIDASNVDAAIAGSK